MNDDPTFDLAGALPFDADADAPTPQKPGAQVLGGGFAYVGKGLTLPEFGAYVAGYQFGVVPPDYVILHHTAIPSTLAAHYPSGAVWDAGESGRTEAQIYQKRLKQLGSLMRYYRDVMGWSAGPHLFIDERWIWLFTPMNTVGVHAKQGNSYRDSGRKLHYSIGIEVLGYYERVVWPRAVAQNVAGAVALLQRQLNTFQYIDRPWAGAIGSHRMYNKPECPGSAIVPAYYMPILKAAANGYQSNPRPPHAGLKHYKVKRLVTGGATIRASPHTNAAVLGRLHAGNDWYGTDVEGDRVTYAGLGSSSLWVMSDDQRCVSKVLLEEAL